MHAVQLSRRVFLRSVSVLHATASLLGAALLLSQTSVAASPDFARDVRPILSQHCFKCHGPDEKARQGGLRLDMRESALVGGDSGDKSVEPGRSSESQLITRITSDDPDVVMPPPSTKHQLTPSQVQLLREWIDAGADYTPHWAFEKPRKHSVVASLLGESAGAHSSAIDALVAAAAREHQLELAPPAERGTWLRRATLDLIGLPPSYEEVQRFARDERPDARVRVVDRLLASPAFGERWGRRWLDLARYADTNGYEKDRPRSIWPYRDWVLAAINDDMSLANFAVKQLAGDLLPNATQSDLVATGFHRNTMINEEGGIDPLEYRFYAMVDRVNTTSTAWLGLTMGCAQCHDHKYDPVTQQDYYAMMALLNNAEEPEFEVFDHSIAQQQQQVDREVAAVLATREQSYPLDGARLRWSSARVTSVRSAGALGWSNDDNVRWISSGKPDEQDVTTIHLSATACATSTDSVGQMPQPNRAAHRIVAIRLRALGNDEASRGKQADAKPSLGWSSTENFVITRAHLESTPVQLIGARATYSQPTFDARGTLDDDPKSGWGVGGHASNPCEITWFLSEPLPFPRDALANASGAAPTIDAASNEAAGLKLVLEQAYGSSHLLRGFEISLGVSDDSDEKLAAARRQQLSADLGSWLASVKADMASWQLLKPSKAKANLARLEPQADGSFLAIGDITKRDEYTFEIQQLPRGTAAVMAEAMVDSSMPKRGPGRTYYEGPIGDFFLSEITLATQGQAALAIRDAWADFAQSGREASKSIDGDPLTGWSIDGRQGEAHRLVIALAEPLKQAQDVDLHLLFERYYAAPLGRVRLWSTTSPVAASCAGLPAELQNAIAEATPAEALRRPQLLETFLSQAPEVSGINAQVAALRKQRPKLATTLIMQPRPAGFVRPTHRYHRGEFLNPRETVDPSVPKFLSRRIALQPRDRLELARWLMHPDHPLVSRVLANRYWSQLFGRGLVQTEEDFGFQGSFPTHEGLLDHLATELIAEEISGGDSELMWSFKRWLRPIVLSETYGRSSLVSRQASEKDASNAWLSRTSRRRLEAEQLRDAALSSAGLLSQRQGGPSVFPPQPASVTTEGTYGKMQWNESRGADRYRRGLYTFSKRTAPFAMLQTFDAPSGEACVARRESGDTPLQALTMLNDVLFLEAAKELGYRALIDSPAGSPDAIVRLLFQRILLRNPAPRELDDMSGYYHEQLQLLSGDETSVQALGVGNPESTATDKAAPSKPDPQVAAATLTARVLLNTDEFINRN